jgi:xanthine dehydrogenase accessory factor
LESLAAQVGFKVERLEGAISSQPRFIVIMTQGQGDQAALAAALESDAPYITFVASQRKANKLMQSLKDKGHSTQKVDAIHSPAGVDIGAETPEEVAVSVLAALIAERRNSKQQAVPSGAASDSKEAATSCCSSSADTDLSNKKTAKTKPVEASSCCSGSLDSALLTKNKKVG